MATRQELERQLVAAHRSGNVQAAQQAAYAIRQYDQSPLLAQVPQVNAPPPIERVPQPSFGNWLENVSAGIGQTWTQGLEDTAQMVQRGASAFMENPVKASAAAFMGALAPAMRGFKEPVETAKDIGAGVAQTGREMYREASSGPMGLGRVVGQFVDMPGPDLPGRRRPTMAELDVYHGTPHTLPAEEGAPLGRFRSEKIGTGEGAQAYGYGLYFAESPDVAKGYQTTLSKDVFLTNNGIFSPDKLEHLNVRTAMRKGDLDSAIELAKKYSQPDHKYPETAAKAAHDLKVLEEIKASGGVSENTGSLYTVDLPDPMIERMLDWDKPIGQQSAQARKAIRSLREQLTPDDLENLGGDANLLFNPDVSVSSFLNTWEDLRGKTGVGERLLQQAGIPGIRYLDAGSRGASEKATRNFVVFPGEEGNLTIKKRE